MPIVKVAIAVDVLETTGPKGDALVLATSSDSREAGRWFELHQHAGRWKCSCPLFRSVGGCPHAGHLNNAHEGEN